MSTAILTPHETKRAYVFPGQGCQYVGMGWKLLDISPAAREVFGQADEALGTHLSNLIFNGPEEDLCDTANSQPAIMTVSVACLRALEELWGPEVGVPAMVAGHSLGECTSLVASGVLGFTQGVRFVRERGKLMHEASQERPGSMAAIMGLEEFALNHICAETGVDIANINSPDQIVVSGDTMSVARTMDLASAQGAKVTPLRVSGGFHSHCMRYARDRLAEVIGSLDLKDPKVPIIANSNSAPLTTADQVRQELVLGVCQCVQWNGSVQFMVQSGVSQFREFGPKKVLTPFIKRIDPFVSAESYDPVSIKKLFEGIG